MLQLYKKKFILAKFLRPLAVPFDPYEGELSRVYCRMKSLLIFLEVPKKQ
jgi:hypothetical protein